jgi:hypothetical protein
MKIDKNIESVSQMLKGEHKTQTKKMFGFSGKSKSSRKIGEIWFEEDEFGNKTWFEQKQGYVYKSSMNPDDRQALENLRSELEKFPKCLKDVCDAQNTALDKKFRFKTGMCSECTFKYEDDLRIAGKYKEYEKQKMLDKAEGIFKDSDAVLTEIVAPFRKGYIEEVGANGIINKTEVDPKLADLIIEEYSAYRNDVITTILGADE